MELSPYTSPSPIPQCIAFFPLFFPFDDCTHNKSTLSYTYSADELVYTVLRNTVHMREMLLKVNEWEFNLAQRALDSLRERRGRKWFIKFQFQRPGKFLKTSPMFIVLLTCWFSFCWCILGRLVEFSISVHPEDGRLIGGNNSLFSLFSSLLSPLN